MKAPIPFIILTISITIVCSYHASAQNDLIAHYPFYQDGFDSLGINDEADMKNVIFADSSTYLDGNYYWDDNMGSHLQIGPLSNWDPEHFRFTLNIKINSLPEGPNLPLVVLGSSWRWMYANVTAEGKIEWAIDDKVIETSDSIIQLGEWTPIIFERDSSQGFTRFIYNHSDTLEIQINNINHNNDLTISASHGGSGRTFKGHWRNLKVFNTGNEVMTSNLSALEVDIRIYPNPVRDYLMIENNNNANFNASLHSISGRKIHTIKIKPFSRQKLMPDAHLRGIYYLELENENQRLVRKIVFQ